MSLGPNRCAHERYSCGTCRWREGYSPEDYARRLQNSVVTEPEPPRRKLPFGLCGHGRFDCNLCAWRNGYPIEFLEAQVMRAPRPKAPEPLTRWQRVAAWWRRWGHLRFRTREAGRLC